MHISTMLIYIPNTCFLNLISKKPPINFTENVSMFFRINDFKLRVLILSMLSKQEALQLLSEHVSDRKKRKHMITVSAIMRELAKTLHMNAEKWELTGMLHDLDYDKTIDNPSKHGLIASKTLEGKLPEECLHAIRAHDHRTGVKPESLMDKALIASDCVWGLIIRAALATSTHKVRQIEVNMLEEMLEDSTFPKFFGKWHNDVQRNEPDPRRIFQISLKIHAQRMDYR